MSEQGRGRFRQMAVGERPQERMESLGAEVLSDSELLAIIIRKGSAQRDVLEVAEEIISSAGSLANVVRWTLPQFEEINGIGRVKALQLRALAEIAKRVLEGERNKEAAFASPEVVYDYLRPRTLGLDVERFWALILNKKNFLLRCVQVTSGIADASLVHAREVFREVIREGGSAVIVAHNHPSGDPAPSAADVRVTRQLRESAKTLDLALLDHVILGSAPNDPNGLGYYSFSDAGLL